MYNRTILLGLLYTRLGLFRLFHAAMMVCYHMDGNFLHKLLATLDFCGKICVDSATVCQPIYEPLAPPERLSIVVPVHVVLVCLLVDQLSSLLLTFFGRPKKFVQSQGIFGQALIFFGPPSFFLVHQNFFLVYQKIRA